VAFLGLACIGAAGFLLFWLLMPETAERKDDRKLLPSGRK
jgi:predicted MFS family arabinose efflux permease